MEDCLAFCLCAMLSPRRLRNVRAKSRDWKTISLLPVSKAKSEKKYGYRETGNDKVIARFYSCCLFGRIRSMHRTLGYNILRVVALVLLLSACTPTVPTAAYPT